MRRRHQLRVAEPRPHAGRAAAGIRPQRVGQLIAAVNVVVPGGKPHGDALAHVVRNSDGAAHRKPRHHQRQPGNRHQCTAARHAVQRQEEARENQRRAHVALQEEEDHRERRAHQRGQSVFHRRNIHAAGERRQAWARFPRVPQYVPTAAEISGQKEHQQQADYFHRLEAQQVHFSAARSGAMPKQNERRRKREAGQQWHEGQLAQQPLVIERTQRRQQQASAHHALREIHEQQVVAHRIAQRDHEDETRAGQQHRHRQEDLVAAEPAQAPEEMHRQECREKERRPAEKSALELRRAAHHEQRLQLPELLAGEEPMNARQGADVGEPAGSVVDLARRFLAGAPVGDGGERRQEIFPRAQRVEIEHLPGGQSLVDFREACGLHLVDQVQPERYQQARCQHAQQFRAAPRQARAPCSRPVGRRTPGYSHLAQGLQV